MRVGILIQAEKASEKTKEEGEKEQISLAYNGAKIKNNGKITDESIKQELIDNGVKNVNASGKSPIVITFDEERSYTISDDGKIELITGNTKEILDNANTAYGKVVTNYDVDGSTGVNWKIFNSDGINIYLIADEYIDYSKIPNSRENNSLNQSDSFQNAAFFANILDDYSGSSDITNDNIAYKWLNKYYEKNYTSEYNNMKAVSYMLDTEIWNNFMEDTASYVIGGPTLEMLFGSYNKKYQTQYDCQAINNEGYIIRETEDSEWEALITGLLGTDDELYIVKNQGKALSYWIASPSNYHDNEYAIGDYLLSIYYSGSVKYSFYNAKDIGFRPIVCLKPDVNLTLQENGTYKID